MARQGDDALAYGVAAPRASADASRTGPPSTSALAASNRRRRGIAASVTWIMPVLYSPPRASTPASAATA